MDFGSFGRSAAAFAERNLRRGVDLSWLYRRPPLFYLPMTAMSGGGVFNTNNTFRLALRFQPQTTINRLLNATENAPVTGITSVRDTGGQGLGLAVRTENAVRYFTALSGQNLVSFYKALSNVFERAERMTVHTLTQERTAGDLFFEMSRFSFPLQYTRVETRSQDRSITENTIHTNRDREITIIERREPLPPESANKLLKDALDLLRRETRSQRARRGVF